MGFIELSSLSQEKGKRRKETFHEIYGALFYSKLCYAASNSGFLAVESVIDVFKGLAELICSLGLQATMFNDESSEFDVLVASDAIGMGLNLNISRIIFSTMRKFDGVEMRELTVPEIKQIAGTLLSLLVKFGFTFHCCSNFVFI